MTKQQEIDLRVNAIRKYNECYRRGEPIISDQEYDSLVDALRELDPNNSWFLEVEPVSANQGRKLKLPIPMRSLDKVKDFDSLIGWLKNALPTDAKEMVIMPKYDGISWLHDELNGITYSRGGSKNEGQDCSLHFKKGGFMEVSEAIDARVPRFTFGELVFSTLSWQTHLSGKISPLSGNPYKSPRNTIAGLINRSDDIPEIEHASFVRYGIDEDSVIKGGFVNFAEILCLLSEVNEESLFFVVKLSSLTEKLLADLYEYFSSLYYIDGLVVYVNSIERWRQLGRHKTTGNPLYAIAYKHPSFTESYITTVVDVNWNVTKSGVLAPTVQIDAIEAIDCVIDSPTGYNARWIRENGIGKMAKVQVVRSGGVIPKIARIITPAPCDLPQICPSCGSPTVYDSNGIHLCCSNPECDGRKISEIVHFFRIIGCDGLGEETVVKIYNAGFKSVAAFLTLKPSDIYNIVGLGDIVANLICARMGRTNNSSTPLPILMHASNCFKGIGETKAQQILSKLSEEDIDEFCQGKKSDKLKNVLNAELEATKNFIAGQESFVQFLQQTKLTYSHIAPERKGDKLAGLNVCFTGVRDKELEGYIKSYGGKIASSVNKNTTHLIAKSPNSTSSKIQKARRLKVPVMTLERFVEIYTHD